MGTRSKTMCKSPQLEKTKRSYNRLQRPSIHVRLRHPVQFLKSSNLLKISKGGYAEFSNQHTLKYPDNRQWFCIQYSITIVSRTLYHEDILEDVHLFSPPSYLQETQFIYLYRIPVSKELLFYRRVGYRIIAKDLERSAFNILNSLHGTY